MPEEGNALCRCGWCGEDALYQAYHDNEWGVPLHDEHRLFAMLILEGAQAGLSWLTILRKRENYYQAFDDFNPELIAAYTDDDRQRLLGDSGIVRNRLKIDAAIGNARAYLKLVGQGTSLNDFLWRYVDGQPLQNSWHSLAELPASTDISEKMSKDLRRLGFRFVGPTICYAYMQSIGMVNDHLVDCFRYQQVGELGGRG